MHCTVAESSASLSPVAFGRTNNCSIREMLMSRLRVVLRCAGSVLLATVWMAPSASAQSVADFYKGKTITVIVGSGAGGGYDTNSRLLARQMSRHIPGAPHIIVQNMPTASGIAALNHIYTVAPRDGTVFSAVVNNMPTIPFLAARLRGLMCSSSTGLAASASKRMFASLGKRRHSRRSLTSCSRKCECPRGVRRGGARFCPACSMESRARSLRS